ncbi:MAG TPA: hypothetical protein VKX45_13110 [Bryobacteraceae bacterium]|nr:hypothetical protein [Bryobacteraceae bacterium]
MNFQLIGALIGLRYKLLWARVRTRNGRIALFMAGYLLFILVAVLMALGGLGAGITAVRSGKAQLIAQIVLGSLFLQALLGTVIMGFGMNAAFSDFELRRYPIGAMERRLTRHLIGIVDPYWFLILALELGLAVGLYVFGSASLGLGVAAVLLLFVCNYLLARVVGLWIDRIMQTRMGSAAMLLIVIGGSAFAGQIPLLMTRHPSLAAKSLRVLAWTPPFGAAAAMTAGGSQVAVGFAILVAWIAALGAVLAALERRPAVRRRVETTAMKFESPLDRVAAWFASEDAPMVAFWMRFFARNNRFRTVMLISLPLVAFFTYNFGRAARGGFEGGFFVAALGAFGIVSFPTSRFAVNQFGYVGGGFRRFFLLPADPAAALRTGSHASLLLSAPLVPLAALGWALITPRVGIPFDPRMVVMLLASSTTGLFLFHGLGLWVTIYNPRRGNYYANLGNDLSLLGNIVIVGGVFAAIGLPQLLRAFAPGLVSPEYWWTALIWVAAGTAFYRASLAAACGAFPRRREALMAVVEGRA